MKRGKTAMKRGAARYQGRHVRIGRKRGGRRRSTPSRENRAVGRLVACGGIFVLLVLIKLLFPVTAAQIRATVGDVLIRDADFREAFAAVGRAVSGEEDVGQSLQDAYVAVFKAQQESGVTEAFAAETAAAIQPAARYEGFVPAVFTEPQLQREVTVPLSQLSDERVAHQIPAADTPLPENAGMEQRNLGFPYQSPVVGKLSSPYGWREHPVEGEDKFHYGVDLAADSGTDIYAFADGQVFATGESSSLGQYIILCHEGDYTTLYAHCRCITKTGGRVKMGEKIAEVGQTGMATGPHLHFQLQQGERYLNPLYYVEVQTT